jgi:hypothetical protein
MIKSRKQGANSTPNLLRVPNVGRRRRIGLWVYGGLVVVLLLGTAIMASLSWFAADASFSDRLVEVTNSLTAGALALAGVGGLIALRAYAAATGLPEILIRVRAPALQYNEATLEGRSQGNLLIFDSYPTMEISLWNKSGFSAKNPAVIVRLENMFRARNRAGRSAGWIDVDFWNDDITGTQWDGGADYFLHGYAVRRIPDLILTGLYSIPAMGRPRINVDILADGGYCRSASIPVKLIVDGQPQYKHTITVNKEWI